MDLRRWPGGPEDWHACWGGRTGVAVMYGQGGGGVIYEVAPGVVCFGRYAPSTPGAYKQERALPPEEQKALLQARRRELHKERRRCEDWRQSACPPSCVPPQRPCVSPVPLQGLCKGWAFPMKELADACDPAAVCLGELWQMPPASSEWGAGAVTLVGDAAHAMLPMLGQGASQGIEGALVLAAVRRCGACRRAACSCAWDACSSWHQFFHQPTTTPHSCPLPPPLHA